VAGLEAMSRGLLAILDREDVDRVTVVGSSLGGYLAQYLVAHHPDRIERAVFANTFPPNERITQQNRVLGALLPFLPAWLVVRFLRRNVETSIYPAAGHSELVRAYLREQSYRGGMSKAQFVARYRCVVDPFTPPDVEALGIPSLLVEADNDPLVEEELREELKRTYPSAQVQTLHEVGHFPYLNEPTAYAGLLQAFLLGTSAKEPDVIPVEGGSV
jgi:pimeloyl-ACP methyl ester carboxylesterase